RDAERVERFERVGRADVVERAGDFGECVHCVPVGFASAQKQKREGSRGLLPALYCMRRDACASHAPYAARLAFAFSASTPNALMSCTAMSASTLRSTVTPAFLRPFIMRL